MRRVAFLVFAVLVGGCQCLGEGGNSNEKAPLRGERVNLSACAASAGKTEPPATLSTLDQNFDAAPSGFFGGATVMRKGLVVGVPQPAGAEKVFDAMTSVVPTDKAALVACRATYEKPLLEDESLSFSVQIGKSPLLEGPNPVFLAGIAIKPGERISATVKKTLTKCATRIAFPLVPIPQEVCDSATGTLGTVAIALGKELPQRQEAGVLALECRAMDRAAVDQALSSRLEDVDKRFAEYCDSVRLDVDGAQWGFPDATTEERGTAGFEPWLADGAAFVGWADPRIRAQRARLEAISAEWKGVLGAWVEKKHAETEEKSTVELPPLAFRLKRPLACTPSGYERVTCKAELELENRSDASLRGEVVAGILRAKDRSWDLDVVTAGGEFGAAEIGGPFEIEVGAKAKTTREIAVDLPVSEKAREKMLLRVRSGATTAFARGR